jgi:hypothetical protein
MSHVALLSVINDNGRKSDPIPSVSNDNGRKSDPIPSIINDNEQKSDPILSVINDNGRKSDPIPSIINDNGRKHTHSVPTGRPRPHPPPPSPVGRGGAPLPRPLPTREGGTENGERRTENGERRTENGERRTGNGERFPSPGGVPEGRGGWEQLAVAVGSRSIYCILKGGEADKAEGLAIISMGRSPMRDVGAYGIRPVSRKGNGERRSASIPRVGLRPTLLIARPSALPKDQRSFLISMGRSPMGGGERGTENGERRTEGKWNILRTFAENIKITKSCC